MQLGFRLEPDSHGGEDAGDGQRGSVFVFADFYAGILLIGVSWHTEMMPSRGLHHRRANSSCLWPVVELGSCFLREEDTGVRATWLTLGEHTLQYAAIKWGS